MPKVLFALSLSYLFFGSLKMIATKQIRHFFIIMILGVMLVITVAFDFGHSANWLTSLVTPFINQTETQVVNQKQPAVITKGIDNQVQMTAKAEQA